MKGLSVASTATQVTPGSDAENDDRWDINPIPLPLCPYASSLPLPSQGLKKEICLRRIGKSGTHRILEKDSQVAVENSTIVAGKGVLFLNHPF